MAVASGGSRACARPGLLGGSVGSLARGRIRPVSDACLVRISGEPESSITIEVLGRMHPGSSDFYDGNWLVSPISIAAGGFTGTVAAGLRSEELRSFRRELERLHESTGGEASLCSMETWIDLRVSVEPRGQLKVVGTMVDEPGTGNLLKFTLDGLDLSFVPGIVRGLSRIESVYPVLGE